MSRAGGRGLGDVESGSQTFQGNVARNRLGADLFTEVDPSENTRLRSHFPRNHRDP